MPLKPGEAVGGRPLLDDALRIWRAGVDAVRPEKILPGLVSVEGNTLVCGDAEVPLRAGARLVVVGGGKAGASMALGLERALGPRLCGGGRVTGIVTVPSGCEAPTTAIELVPGRPPGCNEPRPEGARATQRMLQMVSGLGPEDICICLLSGGGSALLTAPAPGVTLELKAAVARSMSAAGATIEQLNAVRTQMSFVKGGGLARACRAGWLITLAVSDVPGDPPGVIASGPTVPSHQTASDALTVIESLGLEDEPWMRQLGPWLRERVRGDQHRQRVSTQLEYLVIANNAAAVDGAGVEAERLGYNHAMLASSSPEGAAEDVGRWLAGQAVQMRDSPGPNCLISGGEPVVRLAPVGVRGKGGRNQQLVLAAAERLGACEGIALVSGGTDGEDGPTNAAGGCVDQAIAAGWSPAELREHLQRNDAYPLLERAGGLLRTGPTHTNVCDLRVVTVSQRADRSAVSRPR